MSNKAETYRTVNITDEQANFLDAHPQLNFSAICRQAVDAYRDQLTSEGELQVVTKDENDIGQIENGQEFVTALTIKNE